MMVLRSRGRKICFGPEGPQPIELEDPLNGVVLEIKAINLPFIFVVASCPVRGQQNLLVDIRKYDFIRVEQSFADHVISSINNSDDEREAGVDDDLEKLCN